MSKCPIHQTFYLKIAADFLRQIRTLLMIIKGPLLLMNVSVFPNESIFYIVEGAVQQKRA